jgi:large subunit ribosomal protein L10
VAAEYSGLTVDQLTDLRRESRNAGVYLRVVKNTLARRAFDGTEFACVSDQLAGPLILAFSQADPGSAARVIKDYSKKNDKLVVKLVSIDGQALPASELARLASLPTRDQALSMLLGVMKAPIEKFVRTLAEPHTKMVRTVAAVRDQKQAA